MPAICDPADAYPVHHDPVEGRVIALGEDGLAQHPSDGGVQTHLLDAGQGRVRGDQGLGLGDADKLSHRPSLAGLQAARCLAFQKYGGRPGL